MTFASAPYLLATQIESAPFRLARKTVGPVGEKCKVGKPGDGRGKPEEANPGRAETLTKFVLEFTISELSNPETVPVETETLERHAFLRRRSAPTRLNID
jgi:hypothetical protein